MHPIAKQLIETLPLLPHPEGGHFKEMYRSKEVVITNRDSTSIQRSAGTSIYYMLSSEDFSAWHKLKSDEVWHFYQGCPLTVYILNKKMGLLSYKLGNPLEFSNAQFQLVICANQWFAAQPDYENSYSLVGCTVSPGFDFSDFELAKYNQLIAEFPQQVEWVSKFIRSK